jgi:predicted kinase
VCGLKARQEEVPPEKREGVEARARAHFLRACARLAGPDERPRLILGGGLPGVGKTTVGRRLEEDFGFVRISSDTVREELAGLPGTTRANAAFEEGIYSPAWTHRNYAEVRRRAMKKVFQGKRVVVDARFGHERDRENLLAVGRALGVPSLLLFLFEADRDSVRQRIESRTSDPSDADWEIYREAAKRWETTGTETKRAASRVSVEGDRASTLVRTIEFLASEGLASPPHRQHIAAEQPR